jgi:hypothetical protein
MFGFSQMILSQEYVAEDRKTYSYLVFDYDSLYYKLLETIVSFFLSEGEGSALREHGHSERVEQMERYISIHYSGGAWKPEPTARLCFHD